MEFDKKNEVNEIIVEILELLKISFKTMEYQVRQRSLTEGEG